MSETDNKPQKAKRKHKKALIVLLVLVLIIGTICAAVYGFLISKFNKLNFNELRHDGDGVLSAEDRSDTDFRSDEDVINILLVGVDNNYLPGMEQRGNADGIIILSLNKDTKKIVTTSVLRDTRISTADGVSDKATMVYHNHGLDTLVDALEYTFQIKLDNYVMVNYLNVIDIVDAAGGVTVDLKAESIDEMAIKMKNINYLVGDPEDSDILSYDDVGTITLNGKQAAAYMRLRSTSENDFGRTAKIREVLSGLKTQLMGMGLSELNSFADVVLENITTDLSSSDMMSLVFSAPKYMKYDVVTNRIPIDGGYTGDGSYLYPDLEKNRQALYEGIYGD